MDAIGILGVSENSTRYKTWRAHVDIFWRADAQLVHRVGLWTLFIASREFLSILASVVRDAVSFTSNPLIPSRAFADIVDVFKITGQDSAEIVNQVVCLKFWHALNACFQSSRSSQIIGINLKTINSILLNGPMMGICSNNTGIVIRWLISGEWNTLTLIVFYEIFRHASPVFILTCIPCFPFKLQLGKPFISHLIYIQIGLPEGSWL